MGGHVPHQEEVDVEVVKTAHQGKQAGAGGYQVQRSGQYGGGRHEGVVLRSELSEKSEKKG
jgi:hypothetical protein